MKKLGLIVLVTHLLGGAAAAQSGATYYVATNGNDSYSCSQAQSLFTPKRSVSNAVRCLQPGATLLVRGGTYAEGLIQPPLFGTSWSNKIRIAAYPGETVWLAPPASYTNVWIIDLQSSETYVEFDGINLDGRAPSTLTMGGIHVHGGYAAGGDNTPAHHIRFMNAEIVMRPGTSSTVTGNDAMGVDLNGIDFGFNEILNVTIHGSAGPNADYGMYIHSSDNVMDRMEIYDQGLQGIQIYQGGGLPVPSRNIIRNSRIHDINTGYVNGRNGILISGNNNQIYNNVIYNINADGSADPSASHAITVYGGVNNQILNNTIANNRAIAISTDPNVGSTLIANNIAYGNGGDGIVDNGTGTLLGPNDFGTDPGFVDATQGNFQLRLGSVAIDAGTAYSIVPTDAAGVSRPQGAAYDLGAYELTSVIVQVPPQAPTGVQVVQSAP